MVGPLQLHVVFFIIHVIALSYDLTFLVLPNCDKDTFMGCSAFRKLYFLTFWTQIVQTLYFGLNVVNDLFGTNNPPLSERDGRKKRCKLENLRNRYLSSIAFPAGIFVVMTFWSLYYVDRELVFPKFLDKLIPQWLNHIMHTAPLVFLIIDKYIVFHQYPSKAKGMFTTVMFASVYNAWILFIAYYGQIWVYPVFDILNTAQRIMFFVMLWVFMISIYILGESLTTFFWSVITMAGPVQLHAVFFITHVIALSYDFLFLVHPNCHKDTFMGCSVFRKLYFLTFWTQIVQTLYFGLNVVNDLFGTNNPPVSERDGRKKRCKLENLRNRYLSSIAFPAGIFVVMTFWSLYYVDRELVHPKFLDKVVPQWLNHVMHTAPLVFLIIDKYIVFHQYPSKAKGMFTTVMFASVYNVWILFIAYYGQIWVYPVFDVLNTAQRIMFFVMLWVFMISIYILGESLTTFFWRKERAQVSLKQR